MKVWRRMSAVLRYGMALIFTLLACTIVLTVFSCGSSDSDSNEADNIAELTTTRDDKGVWFITGDQRESLYNVFEAVGYAVATDRLWQTEIYRRQSRGTLSEIFGNSQLQSDIYVRTLSYTDAELEEGFSALSAEAQDIINGYVAGFNRRIGEIRSDPSQLPYEFHAIGQQLGRSFLPEDWTYQDVLRWLALLQRQFDPEAQSIGQIENAELYQRLVAEFGPDGPNMFEDLRWINDPDAHTMIPAQELNATHGNFMTGNDTDGGHFNGIENGGFTAAANAMKARRDSYIANLKRINAYVKMGSYAWVVSGQHTESGNPIIYSGPQMGFTVPSIVVEGSINAGGLTVSGMTVPGIPLIMVGRTPHHAWSMQVGHGHSTDYYLEDPSSVSFNRTETIKVAGENDVVIPIYRSDHGPIGNPMPYNPDTYDEATDGPIFSWKYSHWGHEFQSIEAFLQLIQATSMDQFGEGIEKVATSQHFCYADRDGNIAYWMSGRDPLRPSGEWRMPQGTVGPTLEWDENLLKERSTDRNTAQGYYGGWNNKTNSQYDSGFNSVSNIYGPFHRTHVIEEYMDTMIMNQEKMTFEQVRDLALHIAMTDSFGAGGNPWTYVMDYFVDAVTRSGANATHQEALTILDGWNGYFVAGEEDQWRDHPDRADAWLLMDAWIGNVLELTFADEGVGEESYRVLFNVLIHGLEDNPSGIQNRYDWFTNISDPSAPQTADEIIVTALDRVLETLDLNNSPWGMNERGEITYTHSIIGDIHATPYASRSTYAHCVEYDTSGPVRIESMFPLGESGDIRMDAGGNPVFDKHFFSMAKDSNNMPVLFDNFEMRPFPLFE